LLGRVDVVTSRSYTFRVRFEWDEGKREANLRKHGIDFAWIGALFEGFTVTFEDDRGHYGEQRFITFGSLHGSVVVVAHTERGNTIRIISARKASRHEQKSYFSTFSD